MGMQLTPGTRLGVRLLQMFYHLLVPNVTHPESLTDTHQKLRQLTQLSVKYPRFIQFRDPECIPVLPQKKYSILLCPMGYQLRKFRQNPSTGWSMLGYLLAHAQTNKLT